MNNALQSLRRAGTKVVAALPFLRNKYIRSALWGLGLLVVTIAAGFAYAFTQSPAAVRNPQFEHLHFRMQVLVDGKAVNFADKKFQEGYSKDNCNVDLTTSPIHFHDSKNQFVHIHWKQITGGQVLKYYGWNYAGGVDGMLGYRFDQFPNLQTVPIHGVNLPKVPEGAKFYVYSGDENGHKERSFDEFTQQDIETFFGKKSNLGEESVSLLDKLFPKASAHGGHSHEPAASSGEGSQEDLKRLQNLIGNVVIFVQKDQPTDAQVNDRFGKLEPLSDSACAG